MKITLDKKVCLKHKLSPVETMICLAVRDSQNFEDIVNNLINRQVLVNYGGKFMITQHWNDVVDEILADSSGKVDKTDEELLKLAVKIQECFPKQKMRDKFGRETNFYYRCNRTEIKGALKRFYENSAYKNATEEDIIDAAKRYVASFKGDYNGKMRLAKYFIWKNDVKPKGDGTGYVEPLSDLETFLENKESEEEVVTNSDDWLATVRN